VLNSSLYGGEQPPPVTIQAAAYPDMLALARNFELAERLALQAYLNIGLIPSLIGEEGGLDQQGSFHDIVVEERGTCCPYSIFGPGREEDVS